MKRNLLIGILVCTGVFFLSTNLFSQTEWIKYEGNPLFNLESQSSWESAANAHASVVFDGEIYHMWYIGNKSDWDGKIGYATSSDGIHWEKYADNPVLEGGTAGTWESHGVGTPHVVWDGKIFHMWYSGNKATSKLFVSIGYAKSSDGIHWTKHENNPVLVPTQDWEGGEVIVLPKVIIKDNTFQLWYSSGYSFSPGNPAKEYKIGYATSLDGISWKKYENNPVLDTGGFQAEPSTIILRDSVFQMWFSSDFLPDNRWRIGYAESVDGTNWEQFENNPVLNVTPELWDAEGVAWPSVLFNGNAYQMWYTGIGKTPPRIGYAISPLLAHDVWVISMPEHVSLAPILVNNYTPKAKIWNVGLTNESNSALVCKIDSSGVNLYNDTKMIESLESSQLMEILFEEFSTFSNTNYTITFCSNLQNDENASNDTLQSTLTVSNLVDNFELGLDSWSSNAGWGTTDQYSHAGEFSLNDSPGGVYANNSDTWVQFNYSFNLANVEAAHMSYWTRHFIQANDFGYVEISTDSGKTWKQLGEAYTGIQSSWIKQSRSLTDYCGHGFNDVRIRFRLATDATLGSLGWFLDDIEIYPCEVTSAIEHHYNIDLLNNYILFDNYPNPFNAQTNISFQLPTTAHVKLIIYNVLGQRITTLAEKSYHAGSHHIVWDGKDTKGNVVPSGVYFYKLQSNEFSQVKKMLLLE